MSSGDLMYTEDTHSQWRDEKIRCVAQMAAVIYTGTLQMMSDKGVAPARQIEVVTGVAIELYDAVEAKVPR